MRSAQVLIASSLTAVSAVVPGAPGAPFIGVTAPASQITGLPGAPPQTEPSNIIPGLPTVIVPPPPPPISSLPPLTPLPTTLLSQTLPSSLSNPKTQLPPTTLTSRVTTTKTVKIRPSKTISYSDCGGFRPSPPACATGHICIDDPWADNCGQACDYPGICVEPIPCGGFPGKSCPDGKWCIDDPRDNCDPLNGWADCMGICV